MDDLGCGDGKVTLLLKEIFLPTRLRGFDINPHLVKRARDRAIEAEVKNLENNMPTGELAVIWGVLHHIEDIEGCLRGVKENYALIFIREPIKHGTIKWLGELGHPLRKEKLEYLVEKYLDGSQIFYYDNTIFIFYVSPKLNAKAVSADWFLPKISLLSPAANDAPSSRLSRWTSRILDWAQRRGLRAVFITPIVLIPGLFTPIAIAMGTLRFRLWKFFLAC